MIIYTPIYNEMPWTPYFLRHLLEFDCPIMIAEGAAEIKFNNSDRSTDGSWELIKLFAERWSDRVTIDLHDYNLNDHGSTRMTRMMPRETIKIKIWDEAQLNEWIVGLSPDNIYNRSDIKKIKQACKESDKDEYLLMTAQQVFCFNFNTVIIRPIQSICGPWVSLWPCIWRKNNEFIQVLGDELLKSSKSANYLSPPAIQQIPETQKIKHIIIRKDISQFHYKAVKKYTLRTLRYGGKEKAERFLNHPLHSNDLKQYNGKHPSILDSHPWRYVKDCRTENPEFNWKDYIDLVTKI